MASFLENLINNAAKSVNEGIQNRINDGTFNRMAEGVGSGVSSMATGLSSLIGMANTAFGKLKDKVDEVRKPKANAYDSEANERYEASPTPQPAAKFQPETDPDYHPGVEPIDDLMAHIANQFSLTDEELTLYGMARLNALTAMFFACCDGQYTRFEQICVENYKSMIYENVEDLELEDVEGTVFDHLFDEMEGHSLDDIIAMTHRLLNGLKPEERPGVIQGIDDLIREVIDAEARETSIEEDYYDRWHQEFIG